MSLGVIARSPCDEAINGAASPPSLGIRDRGVSVDGTPEARIASSQELHAMTAKLDRLFWASVDVGEVGFDRNHRVYSL
jgi:hypothetical protein